MPIAFVDDLNAKYALDSRSLNPLAYQTLLTELRGQPSLRWLDLGTGTGAMIHRLVSELPAPVIDILGIDNNHQVLAKALPTTRQRFKDQGYTVVQSDPSIQAHSDSQSLSLQFVCQDLLSAANDSAQSLDLITTHAFMDVVPLKQTVAVIADRLVDGGLFYSTLNYDGETTLFPLYQDAKFEQKILAHYDQTMENRRVTGQPTGGAQSGRKLITALQQNDFDVITYGSSDWNLTPLRGGYQDQDQICILALIDMIHGEAKNHIELNSEKLAQWYQDRAQRVQDQQLGMIVHQLDILARKHRGTKV